MKIFHHHTIHHCPACSHCTQHEADRSHAAPFANEMPHARPSLVGALAGVVQLAATLYLLHVDRKRTDVWADTEQDATAPLASPTATTTAGHDTQPPIPTATEAEMPDSTPYDVIASLFADAARAERTTTTDENVTTSATVAQPPRSSLAAAWLAAFRAQPTSA